MVIGMKDGGKMMRLKDKALTILLEEMFITDNFIMERGMVLVSIPIKLVISTTEDGIMTARKEKVEFL